MKIKYFFVLALLIGFSATAFAHEKRKVGEYDFVVGFVNEPAYAGQFNGIDLKVLKGETPVEGLESTLKATVRADEKSMALPLKKSYKKPGNYAGHFIPSRAGDYIFRVEGDINGQKVDETFKTQDGKFHAVGNPSEITFP